VNVECVNSASVATWRDSRLCVMYRVGRRASASHFVVYPRVPDYECTNQTKPAPAPPSRQYVVLSLVLIDLRTGLLQGFRYKLTTSLVTRLVIKLRRPTLVPVTKPSLWFPDQFLIFLDFARVRLAAHRVYPCHGAWGRMMRGARTT